jgi:choline dehydrogenase-like flavoprotein
MNVCRVPRALAGRNAHVVERGARALGWSGEYLHRAARGCVGAGVCAFGCPSGGKQHTGNTYVPRAWDAGAVTYTGCRAQRVTHERGRATGVVARTAGGGRLRVDAPLVVVACGTVGTPPLLAASGLRRPGLGANLSLHPCTAVWAEFDEEIDMTRGVPQSYAIDEFAAEGLMYEGWAGPPDMLALSLPATGAEHRRLMLGFGRVAQFGMMIRDRSRGRVHRLGSRAVVRYDLRPDDAALLRRGIERLARLYFAAGARTVRVPVRGVPTLRGGDLAPLRAARASAGELGLSAFHPLGTAAAGTVVDADLRVLGTHGVHVADGAAVPGALGVNPQLTIMALATRMAFRLLDRPAPHAEPEPESIGRLPTLAA